jgi:hypothetical protein
VCGFIEITLALGAACGNPGPREEVYVTETDQAHVAEALWAYAMPSQFRDPPVEVEALPVPAVPPDVAPAVQPPMGAVVDEFSRGFTDAGGDSATLRRFVEKIVPCESGWQIDPGGYHLGLAQFNPESWASVASVTGFYDWHDPWQMGYNTWTWVTMTDSIESQWACA